MFQLQIQLQKIQNKQQTLTNKNNANHDQKRIEQLY